MSATLYILRRQPDHIPPALFRASDVDIDIVFVERATSITSSVVKGVAIKEEGAEVNHSISTLTYDDLVEKIFSSDHVIVL